MKNEVFRKERFVEILAEYERLDGIYDRINEAASGLEFFEFFDSEFAEMVLEILEEVFGDTNFWIGYFIFELDFGKRWTEDSIEDDGKVVILQTAEDLYDLLVGNPKYLE